MSIYYFALAFIEQNVFASQKNLYENPVNSLVRFDDERTPFSSSPTLIGRLFSSLSNLRTHTHTFMHNHIRSHTHMNRFQKWHIENKIIRFMKSSEDNWMGENKQATPEKLKVKESINFQWEMYHFYSRLFLRSVLIFVLISITLIILRSDSIVFKHLGRLL